MRNAIEKLINVIEHENGLSLREMGILGNLKEILKNYTPEKGGDIHYNFSNSSCFESGSYDYVNSILTLVFNSGSQISYKDVPYRVAADLLITPSAGSFYHNQISGKYETI